jgi:hypothetical protein
MNGSDLNVKHSDRIYRIDRILLGNFPDFMNRFGLSAVPSLSPIIPDEIKAR